MLQKNALRLSRRDLAKSEIAERQMVKTNSGHTQVGAGDAIYSGTVSAILAENPVSGGSGSSDSRGNSRVKIQAQPEYRRRKTGGPKKSTNHKSAKGKKTNKSKRKGVGEPNTD